MERGYSDNEIVILIATGMIIGIAFGIMIASYM